MKKITRNEINKENMVVIGYCQAQTVLYLFCEGCKVGYNSGEYGWNYDLYRVNGVDIVTGYNCPYANKSNNKIKTQLIKLENKLRELSLGEVREKREQLEKEFLEIFR